MKTINIYSYEELSNDAQKKAVESVSYVAAENYLEFDSHDIYELSDKIGEMLGCDFEWDSYDRCFVRKKEDRVYDFHGNPYVGKNMSRYLYWNVISEWESKKMYMEVSDEKKTGRRWATRRSRVLTYGYPSITGMWCDDAVINIIKDFHKRGYYEPELSVIDVFDAVADALTSLYSNSADYAYSEDAAKQYIEDSEPVFYVDGSLYTGRMYE